MHTDAFSTEPWHLLRLISHETHVRDSRGGGRGGGEEKGRKRGAVARDRAENKTGGRGGERRRARGAALFLRADAPNAKKRGKKKRLLINVQTNKLEVQSRTARTILLYRVYPALLSLSVNDRPKEMHTNACMRHTRTHTHIDVRDRHARAIYFDAARNNIPYTRRDSLHFLTALSGCGTMGESKRHTGFICHRRSAVRTFHTVDRAAESRRCFAHSIPNTIQLPLTYRYAYTPTYESSRDSANPYE